MAEKLDLPDIGTLGNPISARAAINSNFTALENAFDNTLSRDGTAPNQMAADIDLNGNDLLNVNRIDADEIYKNGVPFEQVVAYADKQYELFSGTGSQTDFILAIDPGSLGNLEVSVAGVMKRPGLDYTYSGTTLSFTAAPASGTDNILVRYDEALPTGVTNADAVSYTPPSTGVLTTVSDFLDSLWSTGTNLGAKLIRWIHNGTDAQARTVEAKLREIERSPQDYGAAGDGVTDDTACVQAWINACIAHGFKGRLPAVAVGYRLTSQIEIEGAITIIGDGVEMQKGDLGTVQTRGAGSWFFLDHTGVGIKINDPLQYRSGVKIEGVGTYRTQASTSGGSFTPTAHDFDWEVARCDAQFRDCVTYNATKGLRHYTGGYGRLQIDGWRGQPLQVGIQIDDSADTCRIRNVHFWPFFSNATVVRDYMVANAKAIILKDVDNPDISDMFTLGYAYSVSCEPLAGTNAMPLKVRLHNFDFDNGGYGFCIASGGANGVTALISHGYILGKSTGTPANSSNIDIGGNNNVISIDNVGLDLPQDSNLKVTGTGNVVRMGPYKLGRWNFDAGASFGVDVASGNTVRMSVNPIITQAGTTTAVFGGAGTISCPLGAGVTTATTDASGFYTITHGLGIAPRYVTASCQSGTPYVPFPTTTKNTTTMNLQIRDLAGAAVASTSVTVEWHAWY